ncbi:hypothetical protein V6N13_028597 [Hibiscus sabdariffa]
MITEGCQDNALILKLKDLKRKLWMSIRREDREWIQKSRVNWAVAGDRNTKFYHLVASARRRANYISNIEVREVLLSDPNEVNKAVELHFKYIYNDSKMILIKAFDCE